MSAKATRVKKALNPRMAYKFSKPARRTGSLTKELAAAVICATAPYISLYLYLPEGANDILRISYAGCMVATFAGLWVMHSLSRYPGVEASASILTSFSLTFGLLTLTFLLSRFEYSRVMLIGSYALALVLFYHLATRDARHMRMRVGVIATGGLPGPLWQVEWIPLQNPDIAAFDLDAIAVDLRADLPDEWDRALADFALIGMPVFHTKHLIESLTGRLELEHLSENSFGTLSPLSAYMRMKHAADWVAAGVAGVLLIPLFVIVGVLIKSDSPGPVFFKQERMGYRGHPFRVFKFRTMVDAPAGADQRAAAMTASNDMRVTRIGAFLRRTRIDELPQLLNVLRGEMSWIGPRPEAMVLSRWYEEIPFYRYRHIVRPGITGWAQVNQGHVVDVSDVTSKLHYDFYYIKNYGPWLDALIVGRTIKTMVTGMGAK
jgi:lipopolysaccharide/colanic/teichoic acid biosynthesis glycosyltransferase